MPTRSYLKIIGPPVLKALKELEKMSIEIAEVCIMDTILDAKESIAWDPDVADGYFSAIPGAKITRERCGNIISKSSEMLGEYDFFFEWFADPSVEQLNLLIERIDETLQPLGVKYTIETR
jgi:hypothetical protein